MRDGQAGLGHPPWRGGAGAVARHALRLDASANCRGDQCRISVFPEKMQKADSGSMRESVRLSHAHSQSFGPSIVVV